MKDDIEHVENRESWGERAPQHDSKHQVHCEVAVPEL